jgi:hypothetical protein
MSCLNPTETERRPLFKTTHYDVGGARVPNSTDGGRGEAHHQCMDVDNRVECLLCHAVQRNSSAGDASRAWRCARCGQHWDAARVAAVMNYRRWVIAEDEMLEHDAIA